MVEWPGSVQIHANTILPNIERHVDSKLNVPKTFPRSVVRSPLRCGSLFRAQNASQTQYTQWFEPFSDPRRKLESEALGVFDLVLWQPPKCWKMESQIIKNVVIAPFDDLLKNFTPAHFESHRPARASPGRPRPPQNSILIFRCSQFGLAQASPGKPRPAQASPPKINSEEDSCVNLHFEQPGSQASWRSPQPAHSLPRRTF